MRVDQMLEELARRLKLKSRFGIVVLSKETYEDLIQGRAGDSALNDVGTETMEDVNWAIVIAEGNRAEMLDRENTQDSRRNAEQCRERARKHLHKLGSAHSRRPIFELEGREGRKHYLDGPRAQGRLTNVLWVTNEFRDAQRAETEAKPAFTNSTRRIDLGEGVILEELVNGPSFRNIFRVLNDIGDETAFRFKQDLMQKHLEDLAIYRSSRKARGRAETWQHVAKLKEAFGVFSRTPDARERALEELEPHLVYWASRIPARLVPYRDADIGHAYIQLDPGVAKELSIPLPRVRVPDADRYITSIQSMHRRLKDGPYDDVASLLLSYVLQRDQDQTDQQRCEGYDFNLAAWSWPARFSLSVIRELEEQHFMHDLAHAEADAQSYLNARDFVTAYQQMRIFWHLAERSIHGKSEEAERDHLRNVYAALHRIVQGSAQEAWDVNNPVRHSRHSGPIVELVKRLQ